MTRREKRNRFTRWLSEIFSAKKAGIQPRRIVVEPLERREVFAADPFLSLLGSANYSIASDTAQEASQNLVAEGEPAADLVAFAKALADAGVRFFGAAWCPFCNEQKALFQDGAKYLPFIEVTNPDRTANQIGIDEGITQYPTWEFNDGSQLLGVQTLAALATKAGISIPQSSTPFVDILPNVTVAIGSPLMVPIDGYDPNGNPLTITVTSSNPSLISASVLAGNKSWKLNTSFGEMTFQLFEDKAPRATNRIIELTNSGFYNGLTFHRVQSSFVIQGGDPLGNGTGGSTLADFDDQFNVDLQHNRTGVLSFAKSTDDTNDSQFFITEGGQRFLDFNHSIFGQLVEGEIIREAISSTKTTQISSGNNRPDIPVTINTATIFTDTENGIIQLKPTGTGSGSATITVTVSDSEGLTTSRTFTATVGQDTANSGPFLNDIPVVRTSAGVPVNVTLTSQDVEGDTRTYSVVRLGSENFTVTVNSSTGIATVTPPAGFVGQLQFKASVSQVAGVTTDTDSKTDEQVVTVLVGPAAPTAVALVAANDSGTSNSDNVTNAATLAFTVSGTTAGAIVKLKAGGIVVGQATATGNSTTVNVNTPASLGQGAIVFTATQTVSNEESGAAPNLNVTYDTTGPVALASSVFPSSVQAGQALSLNLAHAEESTGLIYAVASAPNGLAINASTGVINWTPAIGQVGPQTFTLNLTDTAGNTTSQQVALSVAQQARVGMTLQVVDTSGNPITTIAAGQNFKVQLLVQDLRSGAAAQGVFSAFADLLYDSNVIEPIATSPISHGTNYTTATTGDTNTVGVVNELGGIYRDAFGSLNSDPLLLAEVTFRAKVSGNPNIRLDAPDLTISDILLFEDASNAEVPVAEVSFGSSSFAVGVNFQLVNDTFSFDEDSGVRTLTPLNNDTLTGGAVLTINAVGPRSSGGTVTISSTGTSLNYTPALNFNGAEIFTYTARNQDGIEQTATITVQVTDVNDPPVAVNDTYNLFSGSTQNVLTVLDNDTRGADANATETLVVTAVSAGSQGGTITVGSSGLTVRYTPRAGFTGPTETFTYTLSDGRGSTATGTVSVNVTPENPPPTAVADSFTAVEDAAVASFNPLVNDSTSDAGETLKVLRVDASSRGSQVNVTSDGLLVQYRPAPNFAGQEVIIYVLQDSRGATTTGQMTFTVSAVNDAPDAVDDSATALSINPTTTISVLLNDLNVDSGEPLTISAVTQPATGKGSLAISSDSKSLIYTPPSSGFEGSFSFSYTLSDGSGLTDNAVVNVTVQSFTPRSIGGEVVVANGFSGDASGGVGGLTLQLSGTDYANQLVSASATVAPDGTYAYTNLAPGNYTIQRESLPFLHDAATSIQLTSGATSGDQLNNTIQVGGLMPAYFDIRDFLGSTPTSSLTVALNANGTQSWYATQGDWASLKAVSVQANTAGDSLVVNLTNDSSQNLSGTVPISNSSRVVQLGQQSSMRLLRIVGTPTEAGVTTASGERSQGLTDSTAPTNFTTTASGLQYRILRASSGVRPTATSSVTVDYKGTLDNGTVFDNSYARSSSSTFGLNQVIAGWTEGLQLVGQGGKIELKIPPALGYGATGQGSSIPPNANLNFIIELISVTNPSTQASGEGEPTAEGEAAGIASPLVRSTAATFNTTSSASQLTQAQLTETQPSAAQPSVLIPSQAIRQLLGSYQYTAQGVLSPLAVDKALAQVGETAQQELSADLENMLVSNLVGAG